MTITCKVLLQGRPRVLSKSLETNLNIWLSFANESVPSMQPVVVCLIILFVGVTIVSTVELRRLA